MTIRSETTPASDPQGATLLGVDGFTWSDIHRAERLADLHAAFLDSLRAADADLSDRWSVHSAQPSELGEDEESRLMIDVARHVSRFIGELFDVRDAQAKCREEIERRSQIYRITKPFLKKFKNRAKTADVDAADVRQRAAALLDALPGQVFSGTVASIGFAVSQPSGGKAGEVETVNSSSGWLRDAQRFPVIIRFDDDGTRGFRRYGGQADVQFYTGDHAILNALGRLWIRLMSYLSYVY